MITSCTYQIIEFSEDNYDIVAEGFENENIEMTVEEFFKAVKFWDPSTSSKIEIHDFFSSDIDMDIFDGTGRQETLHIDSATTDELLQLNLLFKRSV